MTPGLADVRSMTVGWVEEWVHDGQIRISMAEPWISFAGSEGRVVS